MITLKSIIESILNESELVYPMETPDKWQAYAGSNNWKGKLTVITPEKFLSLAAKLQDAGYNKNSLANIEQRIINQLPLDPPALAVDMRTKRVISHEGRHRATVAKKLGIKEIPVFIFIGSNYERVPRLNAQDLATISSVDFLPEQ
jgi:hypothetical protein